MGIETIVKPAVATAIGVGIIGVVYFGVAKPLKKVGDAIAYSLEADEQFHQTYHEALSTYADSNHDGLVSRAEADEFDRQLLKDKGVTLLPGHMPRYKEDGKEVPKEIVTEWIKNYNPQ